MTTRTILILIGGLIALVTVAAVSVALAARAVPPPAAGVQPPTIGGQKVPAVALMIDFDKRYDIYCSFFDKQPYYSFFDKQPTVFRGCKVVGFTAPVGEGEGSRSSGYGSSGYSSSGQSFGHWLVLELSDGRLAYIPADAIKYLEEAKGH